MHLLFCMSEICLCTANLEPLITDAMKRASRLLLPIILHY